MRRLFRGLVQQVPPPQAVRQCKRWSDSVREPNSVEVQPPLRLHEPGADQKAVLRGLPSPERILRLAAKWWRCRESLVPGKLAEAVYALALHKRAGWKATLARRDCQKLFWLVHWLLCERRPEAGQVPASATEMLLVAYALTKLDQKHTFCLMLPKLREVVLRHFDTLTANELSKLAWMLPQSSAHNDPLLPEIARLSAERGMEKKHLVQIAVALAQALTLNATTSWTSCSPGKDGGARQLIEGPLRSLLESTLPVTHADTSKDPFVTYRSSDVYVLASVLLHSPASVDLTQFYPRLAALAVSKSLDPNCVATVRRLLEQHPAAIPPPICAKLHGMFEPTLADIRQACERAAGGINGVCCERAWARESPREYQSMLEAPGVTFLSNSDTMTLLRSVGVADLSPEFRAFACEALKRERSKPWLDIHPIPTREQTFAYVHWDLRSDVPGGAEASGSQVLRSGGHQGGRAAAGDGPLVGLTLDGKDRRADAEIQALRLILSAAAGLGERVAGSASLLVDLVPCVSCIGAMAQFRALLPHVHLNFGYQQLPIQDRRVAVYSLVRSPEAGATTSGEGPSFSGGLQVLRSMLQEAVVPSSAVFHSLITFGVREGRLDEALEVLALMREHGVLPEANTFRLLLRHVPAGESIRLLEEMRALGLGVSQKLVGSVLQRCMKEDPFELAPKFLGTWCSRPGATPPCPRSCALTASAAPLDALPCWSSALQAWAQCSWQSEPSERSLPFRALLKVACSAKDPLGSAKPVLAVLSKCGLAPGLLHEASTYGLDGAAQASSPHGPRVDARRAAFLSEEQVDVGG